MPSRVEAARCDGCGICVFLCGAWVYEADPATGKAVTTHPEDCVECFICELVCPQRAITVHHSRRRLREAAALAGGLADPGGSVDSARTGDGPRETGR